MNKEQKNINLGKIQSQINYHRDLFPKCMQRSILDNMNIKEIREVYK